MPNPIEILKMAEVEILDLETAFRKTGNPTVATELKHIGIMISNAIHYLPRETSEQYYSWTELVQEPK